MAATGKAGRIGKGLTGQAFSALGCSIEAFVVVAILVFGVATCSGRVRSSLRWLGVISQDNVPRMVVRTADLSQPKDARLVESLGAMTDAAGISRDSVRVALVVSKELNAAALDANSFLLFEGLDDAPDLILDAVMAHEAAHAQRQHSEVAGRVARLIAGATKTLGVLVGASSDGRREAAKWATGLAMPVHSREQELEADAGAVEILRKAGYSEDALDVMQTALEFLADRSTSTDGGVFDSHPALSDRIRRIRSMRPSSQLPWESFEAGFKEILADPRVVSFTAASGISIGTFSANIARYMDDNGLLVLMAMRARMVEASSEPVCASFFRKDNAAMRAAINHLDADSIATWLRVVRTAVEAQLRGAPPRVASRAQAKVAYEGFLSRLPESDASRYKELAKKKRGAQDDLCWAARRFFAGVVSFPDHQAAANLSLAWTNPGKD